MLPWLQRRVHVMSRYRQTANAVVFTVRRYASVAYAMARDQPNSRFHGRDIFREIGLLP